MTRDDSAHTRGAYGSAISAFLMWGLLPMYWHLLSPFSALEVLAHRIIWSLVFLGALLWYREELDLFRRLLSTRKFLRAFFLSAMVLSVNWGLFIWAVQNHFVVECSLGYFLSPLFTFLIGVIVLHERVRPLQWASIALAFSGVVVSGIAYGSFPWIAVTLAGTFSFYTLLRRRANGGSLPTIAVETLLMTPVAVIVLGILGLSGSVEFPRAGGGSDLLLVCSGIATAFPLLLFSRAAKVIPFSTLGILQYIGPSVQLLLAIWWFREPVVGARIVSFVLVWCGISLFSIESFVRLRGMRAVGGDPQDRGFSGPGTSLRISRS